MRSMIYSFWKIILYKFYFLNYSIYTIIILLNIFVNNLLNQNSINTKLNENTSISSSKLNKDHKENKVSNLSTADISNENSHNNRNSRNYKRNQSKSESDLNKGYLLGSKTNLPKTESSDLKMKKDILIPSK